MEKQVKTVSLAFLQTPISIPGLFTTQSTLSREKTPKLKMEVAEHGLQVSQDGITAIIPYANVKVMVLK